MLLDYHGNVSKSTVAGALLARLIGELYSRILQSLSFDVKEASEKARERGGKEKDKGEEACSKSSEK